MSLQPQPVCPVPEETARIARAAFPRGNVYMRVRDALGSLYSDETFADLFPTRGQPAETPWRLALVTVMQFAEGLPDRQAADAVRGRIDWKYALGLEVDDAGFDASVLSEFRARLVAGGAEETLLDTLLTQFRDRGLLKARGRQRTDSTHVLAAIHVLNRLECVGETLRHALNALAVTTPEWLRSWVPSAWVDRYGRPIAEYRLPSGRAARYALAESMGADGFHLLAAVYDPSAPSWLRDVPAVRTLRRVWVQQFYAPADAVRWRDADDLPPASLLIRSPYDPEARYGKKRDTEWSGYKVHLTETCDDAAPHLITNVETTPATTTDVAMTGTIHTHLAAKGLLPDEHIVDAGFMTADHVVTSQVDHGCQWRRSHRPGACRHELASQGRAGFRHRLLRDRWGGAPGDLPPGARQRPVEGAPRPPRARRRPHPLRAGGLSSLPGSRPLHAGSHAAAHLDDPRTRAPRRASSSTPTPDDRRL